MSNFNEADHPAAEDRAVTIVDTGVEHEIRYSELRNRSAAG